MKKLILLSLLLTFAHAIFAQNLVNNGSFDAGISDWENEYPGDFQINWVADDGYQSNGSLELTTVNNSSGVNTAKSNQIEVINGATYHLQAWVKPSLNTDTEGAALWAYMYDKDGFFIGMEQSLYVFTSNTNGEWTKLEGDIQFIEGAKSVRIAPGVHVDENTNSIASSVRFDDIRFSLKGNEPDAFAMVPGHSALWYNPDQNGHGINVYMLANQRVIVIWYVYDDFGNPLWLLGVGTHDGFKAIIDVNINTGAKFPPNFESSDVISTNWGKFELSFTDCNNGNFKWIPNANNGFSAGEMSIQRINNTLDLACSN